MPKHETRHLFSWTTWAAQCVHDILSVYAILQKKKIVYEKIVQNMWGGN